MSTHLLGFQSFFRFLHHFALAKSAPSSIRVKVWGEVRNPKFTQLQSTNLFKNKRPGLSRSGHSMRFHSSDLEITYDHTSMQHAWETRTPDIYIHTLLLHKYTHRGAEKKKHLAAIRKCDKYNLKWANFSLSISTCLCDMKLLLLFDDRDLYHTNHLEHWAEELYQLP